MTRLVFRAVLGLQSGEARVGPNGCSVCRGVRQGCVWVGRDTADFRGAPIVQNVSGDGAFEQGHDGVSLSVRPALIEHRHAGAKALGS